MKKHAKSLILGFVFLFCCISFLLVIDADFVSVSGLEYRMLEFGSWAPFVFVMLCVFRSFMFLPCGVLSVAGGILFGPFYGGLLTLAGFTANSAIVYFMAGYFGRDWVKRLLKDRFNAIDSFINQNSFISILYLRIVPLLPFDAVSCLGGISKAKKKNTF